MTENEIRELMNNLEDPEKKDAFINKLLDSEGGSQIAAFINGDGKVVTINEIVQEKGREYAYNMLSTMLDSLDKAGGKAVGRQITSDEAAEILYKVENGTATDDEKALAALINTASNRQAIKENGSTNTIELSFATLLEIMQFARTMHYNPTFDDMTTLMMMLMIGSFASQKGTTISEIPHDRVPDTTVAIGQQVKDDMQKAFTASLNGQAVDKEYIILGLLTWLEEICTGIEFAEPKEISGHYGIDLDENSLFHIESDKDQKSDENGSNKTETVQPVCHDKKVVSFKDKAMKDMLKDD